MRRILDAYNRWKQRHPVAALILEVWDLFVYLVGAVVILGWFW